MRDLMATRIAIIGGFLGAGKTTLITRIAKSIQESGRNVGIIMNDQGVDLVDSQYSCSQGLDTCDVQGGCFCCRFPDFMNNAENLIRKSKPEFILAEPVGSCTDLLATVIGPLKVVYAEKFSVAPLIIMVDASRIVTEGISDETLGGFLRKHQIQEAEYVVLSKSDLIMPKDVMRIKVAIQDVNDGARVIPYSAISDEGYGQILKVIDSKATSNRSPKDIDYELYAQAEAELGWYNGKFEFLAQERVDSYDLATKILKSIGSEYDPTGIAHAKLFIESETNAVKMSQVGSNLTVDLVKGSRYSQGEVKLFVNARIVSSPERLKETVRRSVEEGIKGMGFEVEKFKDDCFSPSPPRPYYRMAKRKEA
jgi:G3E family GTPase